MPAPHERSVCSARVQPSTTGSTASRWLGFGASVTATRPGGRARAGRGEVVLDVARAAFVRRDDGVDRPLALELAQDRLVRTADGVASTLSRPRWAIPITTSCAPASAASSIASSSIGTITSRPSSENCFWPRNARRRYCSKPSARQTRSSSRRRSSAPQRLPVAAGLDRLAEPDTLGVIGDVLDLVGDRSAVDLPQGAGAPRAASRPGRDAQQPRRDARLQLRRQRRDQPRLVECRVAERLRAERVEARGQVPVRAVRLDERRRCGDAAEERLVDLARTAAGAGGSRPAQAPAVGAAAGPAWPLPRRASRAGEAGRDARRRGRVAALEELAPLGGTASGFSR